MTAAAIVDLDVRPILRAGGEPFDKIMIAVNSLQPGQGLRLLATFKPSPLLHVLGSKGFTHRAKELDDGDWEVVFTPNGAASAPATSATISPGDDSVWPDPAQELDNRDLDPPEPLVRILAAVEVMKPGEVLSALLCREPIFLFPELAKRGHSWRGAFEADRTSYKILIRTGASQGVPT
jgi:TusA-related sulfurtransferase